MSPHGRKGWELAVYVRFSACRHLPMQYSNDKDIVYISTYHMYVIRIDVFADIHTYV